LNSVITRAFVNIRFHLFLSAMLFALCVFSFSSCSMFSKPYSGKILVYHGISAGEEETVYYRNVEKFRNDMEYIQSMNLDVISYDEMINRLETGQAFKRPFVVIAFDDGLSSDYENAYPILKEFDYPAIFFLLGTRQGNWNKYAEMTAYRNDQNEQLFAVGSHSYSHIKHAFLCDSELGEQFVWSREAMKDYFGVYPDHLALPFGSGIACSKVRTSAMAAGFKSVRGIVNGLVDQYSDPARLNAKLIYSYTKIENVIH